MTVKLKKYSENTLKNRDTYTQTITQRPFPTALPSAVAETRTQEWYSD